MEGLMVAVVKVFSSADGCATDEKNIVSINKEIEILKPDLLRIFTAIVKYNALKLPV